MDLEKCKACGHDVALSAMKCPCCGANLRQQRAQDPAIKPLVAKWAITQCIGVVLFAIIFLGTVMWGSAEDSSLLSGVVARNLRIAKIVTFAPIVPAIPLAIYQSKLKEELKKVGYFS